MTAGPEPWTVRRLLEWTTQFFTRKEVDSPRLSAELLLSHVLSAPRIKLYTDYEKILKEPDLARYRDLVKRAVEHEPIQYLTGLAHFFSLEFEVTPAVLIPRPDTETLVEHVLQAQRNLPGMEAPRVLDLCTGSGCIAAAVAKNLKSAVVTATDLSPTALTIAQRNFQRLGLSDRITILQGDLFAALQSSIDSFPFNIIVSNPPYIPSSQIPTLDRNVRDFEPLSALDGGPDGLDFHRRILTDAPNHLTPTGRLYLEIAFDQGPPALQLASQFSSYNTPKILKDYNGRDRVLSLTRV